MSEHMFGVERRRVSKREAARRDKICRAEGGYGYSQIDESHGTAEGGRWISWYSGPNLGEPHDSALADRVMVRVAKRRGRCSTT